MTLGMMWSEMGKEMERIMKQRNLTSEMMQ
jgi:hypothetical protein